MYRTRAIILLGLDPGEWKRRRNALVRKHHPDSGDGNTARYQEAIDAYNYLRTDNTKIAGPFIASVSVQTEPVYEGVFLDNPVTEGTTVLERDFQRKILVALTSERAYTFNVHGHAMQKSGLPDLYVAHTIWTGWLELKTKGGRYSPIQIAESLKLIRCGVPVFGLRLERGDVMIQQMHDGEILARFEWDRTRKSEFGLILLRNLKRITEELEIGLGDAI